MRCAPVRTSLLAVGLAIVAVTLPLRGQAVPSQATPQPVAADAKTQGAVLFRQECVFCHGVGARGGMRGPDLTTGAWSHGGSDEEVTATRFTPRRRGSNWSATNIAKVADLTKSGRMRPAGLRAFEARR